MSGRARRACRPDRTAESPWSLPFVNPGALVVGRQARWARSRQSNRQMVVDAERQVHCRSDRDTQARPAWQRRAAGAHPRGPWRTTRTRRDRWRGLRTGADTNGKAEVVSAADTAAWPEGKPRSPSSLPRIVTSSSSFAGRPRRRTASSLSPTPYAVVPPEQEPGGEPRSPPHQRESGHATTVRNVPYCIGTQTAR